MIRPWSGAGARCTRPLFSSVPSISIIDCGVTYERRASWAFDRPLPVRRTESAVNWVAVSPYGAAIAAISRRMARSNRAIT